MTLGADDETHELKSSRRWTNDAVLGGGEGGIQFGWGLCGAAASAEGRRWSAGGTTGPSCSAYPSPRSQPWRYDDTNRVRTKAWCRRQHWRRCITSDSCNCCQPAPQLPEAAVASIPRRLTGQPSIRSYLMVCCPQDSRPRPKCWRCISLGTLPAGRPPCMAKVQASKH